MRLSIRSWSILTFNGLVLAGSLLQGSVAQRVAGKAAEERMAVELSAGVSRFLSGRSFPLTNTMMGYLREILNEDWIAIGPDGAHVAGSSLAPELTIEFQKQFADRGQTGDVTLRGREYYFRSHEIPTGESMGSSEVNHSKLIVLIPRSKLQAASNRVSKAVAVAVLPMALGATAVALALAFLITRPILSLSQQMDRLAASRSTPMAAASMHADIRMKLTTRGPAETRQLAASFFSLIDRLDAAMVRLVQSDRLVHLGKMCLSVGHELRNPLSGIKMNMRVLRDRLGRNHDEGIEAIDREIDRMSIYLGELMSIGSGKPDLPPSFAPLKLSALSDGVLSIMGGRCRHLGIEVVKDYSNPESLVYGDAQQLRQAMMNLMVNGMDAMPGGGTLTLRIHEASTGVAFEVRDTGTGVTIDSAGLFEAFSSNKPGGVGLGLYLSKQVIERHSGSISHVSSSNGAVFRFTLPAMTTAQENHELELNEVAT